MSGMLMQQHGVPINTLIQGLGVLEESLFIQFIQKVYSLAYKDGLEVIEMLSSSIGRNLSQQKQLRDFK
jgi:hypothetical protein